MYTRQEAKMQQAGETNKKEGEAFLSTTRPKRAWLLLPSGLQYKILKGRLRPETLRQ